MSVSSDKVLLLVAILVIVCGVAAIVTGDVAMIKSFSEGSSDVARIGGAALVAAGAMILWARRRKN